MNPPTDKKITVRLTNESDHDGFYAARVHIDGAWDRTFLKYDRDEALSEATTYAAWLREHDTTEQEIEL